MTAFSAKHLHSWRLFECPSFLKSGLQIPGYMNGKRISCVASGDSRNPFCDQLLLVPGAGKIAHSHQSVAFSCPAHLWPCVPSWDDGWTTDQDALSRQVPRFIGAMWQMVEIQPEQETRPVEWLPCLMVETWWVSTICLAFLSQTLGSCWRWCSADSPSSVPNPTRAGWTRKLVWQDWYWRNLRVSFSLERGVCARYKAMQRLWGRGNPVLQKKEVFCMSSYDGRYGCVTCDCSVEACWGISGLQVVCAPYWSWASSPEVYSCEVHERMTAPFPCHVSYLQTLTIPQSCTRV